MQTWCKPRLNTCSKWLVAPELCQCCSISWSRQSYSREDFALGQDLYVWWMWYWDRYGEADRVIYCLTYSASIDFLDCRQRKTTCGVIYYPVLPILYLHYDPFILYASTSLIVKYSFALSLRTFILLQWQTIADLTVQSTFLPGVPKSS